MSRRRSPRPLGLPLLAVLSSALLAAASVPARACGYDGLMSDLTAQHPRSIDVALALRASVERGEIQTLEALPPPFGFLRANRLLQRFAPSIGGIGGVAGSTRPVAVLLIESGLWTRYTISDAGQAMAWPHIPGPQPGDAVMVTGEAVLEALIAGTLAAERAVERGLLLLPAPVGVNAGE
jgi:hypothetical protein